MGPTGQVEAGGGQAMLQLTGTSVSGIGVQNRSAIPAEVTRSGLCHTKRGEGVANRVRLHSNTHEILDWSSAVLET